MAVGCAAVTVFSDSDCGWKVEAWAVERVSGSLVRGAPPPVERCCGGVVRCAVGADERMSSAAAESGDVRAVRLYQFKTVQRILQRKQTYAQQPEVTPHHPDHEN